jgi:predicted PurR-regulated permease PerM
MSYLNTILVIFSFVVALISIIYKIKSNFIDQIVKFIKNVEEDVSLTNTEKMDMVIKWIQNIIPRLFKVVFSEKVLRQIAQNIYDDMKAYREAYIKNKTGMTSAELSVTLKSIDKH